MTHGFQLLGAAFVLAIIAWAFWHFLGNDGFGVLSTIALLVLVIDNIRLRRKLKSEQKS
ncbi:hypothetical protein [Collimonas sp. OK307]|uniref:hypothetical protein n=1 Tax=Collimonas sp. OK307 TaxID=1801620 RepID=UPI001587CBFF|nr:hypothetical protein [Collimonas sp. OK307]